MEQTVQPDQPVRVLVVAAHPDDPEFGCGGTAAKWAQDGKEVYYLVCTRGHKGSSEPEMTSERLVEIREREQRAAAEEIGAKEVNFLPFIDGELTPNLEFRKAITREIRRVRPQIVLTHDPTVVYSNSYINHPDHRAVGTATLDSVFPTARDRLNFPEQEREGLLAYKVKEVYLWGSATPNEWVDISPTIDRKIAAIRRHESQVGQREELAERIRERAQKIGESQNLPYAEAFFKITMAR
jgi:LmbE family N-acetylglucosaminyl deacetylase